MIPVRFLLPLRAVRLQEIVMTALVCVVLGGCARLRLNEGEALAEVTELRHANVCNSVSGAAAVTMLPDADAVRAWQQSRGIDLIGDAPLPAGPFAIIEHGTRNTGGYAVVIGRRALIRDGVLLIQASFFTPTGGQLMPEMLTSPCALAQIPVGNYDTVFLLDPRGRRRAVSSEPPRPTPATSAPAQ